MKKMVWVVLLLAAGVWAQDLTPEALIAEGDSAFDAFDNQAALEFYTQALQQDSTNCEALWKTSRAYTDLGEVLKDDEQKAYYQKADAYADKAIAACPDNSNAHLFKSVAIGRVALISGKKQQVQLSAVVKAEAEKALELDPNSDIAHHVLGRWHRKVANLGGIQKMFAKILYGGLPDASNEKAVEEFQKAIKLNPGFINHHLELALTYEEMKEWEKAKAEYEAVLSLPKTNADDDEHKAVAQEHLEKVMKKI